MKQFIKRLEDYSPSVLRISMSAVMLWFSFEQFMHNEQWTAYVPDYAISLTGFSATTLVYFNAFFEFVFGTMLLFGLYVRVSALLLALHLFDIMFVVGYGEVGVRDFGLAFATLVVFMNGPDLLSWQQISTQDERINQI